MSLWLAFLACNGPDPDPDDGHPIDSSTPPDGDPIVAAGQPSTHIPSVLWVTVEAPPPGTAFVEYGIGSFDLTTPEHPSSTEPVPVIGLKAGQTYQWRAVVVDAEGERRVSEEQTFAVPPRPASLLATPISVDEPESEVQFVLAGILNNRDSDSWVGIVDRDGDWVWWTETSPDTGAVTVEFGRDGASVVWSEYDIHKLEDIARIVRISLDGATRTDTLLPLGTHDFAQQPDGTFAYLRSEFGEYDLPAPTRVASEQIAFITEGSAAPEPGLGFSMLEDFPTDPELLCSHQTASNPFFGGPEAREWTHTNSMTYSEEEDAWYLLQRFTDYLIKVDAGTGEVLWTMNGLHGDFLLNGTNPWRNFRDVDLWSHGHMSDAFPGGAMVFDNNGHLDAPGSRVLEVAWDEPARTVEIVWSFDAPDGARAGAIGDVRRMPGGNVLINWAGIGSVMEVTRADHRIVWQADIGDETYFAGRVVPLQSVYPPSEGP